MKSQGLADEAVFIEDLKPRFESLGKNFEEIRAESEQKARQAQIERRNESKQLKNFYGVFFKNREFVERRDRKDFRIGETPDEFVKSLTRQELAQQIEELKEEIREVEREIVEIDERVERLRARKEKLQSGVGKRSRR
jgi:predicted  nucleic acid-binding Zn-ribbon protein